MYVNDGLLLRHVLQSNAIEGIRAYRSDPLVADHLHAARIAARGTCAHPLILNAILARRLPGMKGCAGQYRTCEVAVGRKKMPRSSYVPALMARWEGLVREFQRDESAPDDLAAKAFLIHVAFLCIHPFPDTNGRTARLVWNDLRVSKALPWHVQMVQKKWEYYAAISSLEDCVFRPYFGGVY